MAPQNSQFEASAPALGYLYQFAHALAQCIEQSMVGIEWSIAVEAADDIEQHVGSATALQQLKHRAPGTRMTDAAPDLWKTLRIWCEAAKTGRIDTAETKLLLFTTADLPSGTAGFYLQAEISGTRDEEKALEILQHVSEDSNNESLRSAFESFRSLKYSKVFDQQSLASRIEVIGSAPRIEEVRAKARRHVSLAVGHDLADAFLTRLEGWFYDQVVEQLRSPDPILITGAEFDQCFSDLRNQFSSNNLPVDQDIIGLSPEPDSYRDKGFVRQLELAGVGTERVRLAVRDYVRAFTQRSRWSEENLVRPGEIADYERRLVEEWQARFAEMREDLGYEATEQEMKRQAKLIYGWVDKEVRTQIRPHLKEVFVPKGSFHILADQFQVGWHPEFVARLIGILEPSKAS